MDTLNYILLLVIAVGILWFFLIHKKQTREDPTTRIDDLTRAHPGTDTVFVGIYLDDKGEVNTTTKGELAHPGEKVLYSSANEFKIIFKNQKSPVGEPQLCSGNDGVLQLKIPKDILEKEEFIEEFEKTKELVFDYDIKIGDKTLDPPLFVRRK